MVNAVYYFGYCRTLSPPPPDDSVFIAVRRDARLNPRRSIYLFSRLASTQSIGNSRQFLFLSAQPIQRRRKKKPAKLQQQPYIEAMHVPSSRPWNSKFVRHKHDHYAYKRSMQIEVSNRCRKATRLMYMMIYSVHIPFSITKHHVQRVYIGNYYIRSEVIHDELTLLWIVGRQKRIEEKRFIIIIIISFRLNSREMRFRIVITLQRKFPYRSCVRRHEDSFNRRGRVRTSLHKKWRWPAVIHGGWCPRCLAFGL